MFQTLNSTTDAFTRGTAVCDASDILRRGEVTSRAKYWIQVRWADGSSSWHKVVELIRVFTSA